jgi:hypothetical protein
MNLMLGDSLRDAYRRLSLGQFMEGRSLYLEIDCSACIAIAFLCENSLKGDRLTALEVD